MTHIAETGQRGLEQARSDAITRWLNAPNPSTNYNKAHQLQHPGTARWLLESDAFAAWKQRPGFLWLYGTSGCGKTVLSSAIIHNLFNQGTKSVVYFYFDFNDDSKKRTEDMLRSILVQLYHKHPAAREKLKTLYAMSGEGGQQLSLVDMQDAFKSIVRQLEQLSIVVDALDESDSESIHILVEWIRDTLRTGFPGLRILVTSRKENILEREIREWKTKEELLEIPDSSVNQDICTYLRARLEQSEFGKWQPTLKQRVEQKLAEKADGM